MRELLPNPTVFEVAQIWKWVRYYVNNWRLDASQTLSVQTALTECYWQGFLSWSELQRCERLLPQIPRDTAYPETSANHLVLALSHVGMVIQNDYQITDIAGFVDQGIVFQARKQQQTIYLLALTVDPMFVEEILNPISQVNQLKSNTIITVNAVIKTSARVYLEISTVGQPLCAWLFTKHPTGLPKALAQNLMQQIYQLLLTVSDHKWVESFHSGQLFIDEETYALSFLPCTSTSYYALHGELRSQFYQAPRMFAPTSEFAQGYRLSAIAYELYTGCVPQTRLMQAVLQSNANLSREQKKWITRALILQQPASLAMSALFFNANKKYMKRDTGLLAFASLFALGVVTWQTVQFLGLPTVNEVAPATVVMAQDKADQHINLLKAAFFTQIQTHNLSGANASWQALQQLLPADDVFIVSVAPQLLAKAQAAVYAQNNHSMQIPEPLIEPVADAAAQQEIAALTEDLAQMEAAMAALPPLPVAEPVIVEQLEQVVMADPCLRALSQENNGSCMDALSNAKFGPGLSVVRLPDAQLFTMTQQAVSIADFNQYCIETSHCKPYESKQSEMNNLDLSLGDIESVLNDYNAYCRVSGSCAPLDVPIDPVRNLTPKQIQAYAAWLSNESGYIYRLPTVAEWQHITQLNDDLSSQTYWLLDATDRMITTNDLDSNARPKDKKLSAFYLVRELDP